ncbi:MAG: hypothetical protein Kow0022_06710 [Phycisphaerales bacterium]
MKPYLISMIAASIVLFACASASQADIQVTNGTFSSGGVIESNAVMLVLGEPLVGHLTGPSFDLAAGFVAAVTEGGPACSADTNSDGRLDFFDIQIFLNWFAVNDGRADFTGDGLFDFFDVQTFLQAFSQGCP